MNADNVVMFTGNVTKDPEVKDVGQSKVAKFSIAINRYFKKDGEKHQKTSFVDLEAWGDQTNIIEKFVKKGSKISVVGEVVQDVFEVDGQKRSKIFFRVDNLQLRDKKEVETTSVAPSNDSSVPF